MNTKPKLTKEQKIQQKQERNEIELQKAQRLLQELKAKQRRLDEEARIQRLLTRAEILEGFLQEPEILTNDDVSEFLAYLFKEPIVQQRLKQLLSLRKTHSESSP